MVFFCYLLFVNVDTFRKSQCFLFELNKGPTGYMRLNLIKETIRNIHLNIF